VLSVPDETVAAPSARTTPHDTGSATPACSVVASSAAHADPVATTATEYLDKADGWDYSVPAW